MLFGQFGNVQGAEILYNDRGSRGFGFVTMSRGRDADIALSQLNHSIVEGRVIQVGLATPKVKKRREADLASRLVLVEAETRLYQAQLEVLKLQQQLQSQNHRVPLYHV